jgi:hypothetical protein
MVAEIVSPHLVAVGPRWEDGPAVGAWIAERLGSFGPNVGHAVPLGYPAYAIVPIPWDEDADEDRGAVTTLDALLDVLEPFSTAQTVHSGIWPGFGWMYDTGQDPRHVAGAGLSYFGPEEGPRPTQDELDRQRAEVLEKLAAELVEQPDAALLELPHREYYVWGGPLRSALAFRQHAYSPPSLIWPEDRSWFVGAPIYTNEFAMGGSRDVVDAILGDARLAARTATPDDQLDIDD